jgi:hypothetical protein
MTASACAATVLKSGRCPPRQRKMSGEALTTPTSAIGDLTGKLVEIDVE